MSAQPHMLLDTTTTVIVLVAALVIGCIIGSFLNVVIWRVPNHISIVNPKRSFCPTCKAQIAWYDNIPVISWMVLHAKCRNCKEPISARYPLVETLTGLAFTAVMAGGVFGLYDPWALPELFFLAAMSIVVAFIDLDHHLILNVIIYPSLAISAMLLALASLLTGDWMRMAYALVGAVALGAFYLLLALIWVDSMGGGDIKLAVVLGLVLGWLGWPQLIVGAFGAFLVGGIISIVMLAMRKVKLRGGIPFGPSMVVGAWIGIFAGVYIANWYLQISGLA